MSDTGTRIKAATEQLRIVRPDDVPQRTNRKRRRFPWVTLVILSILGVGGWIAWPHLRPFIAQARAVPVKTGSVIKTRPGASAELTNATGYVVARRKAAVSAKLSGRITDLRVDVGSRVKKGDLIAKLEDEIYRAAVDQAKADLNQAKAEEVAAGVRVKIAERTAARQQTSIGEMNAMLDQWGVELTEAERIVKREQDLMERKAGTPEAVSQAMYKRDLMKANIATARTKLQSAQAALAESEAAIHGEKARIPVAAEVTKHADAVLATAMSNLADTELRAEFDAVVLRKEADVGEMVVPGLMGGGSTRGSVVTLADFSTLEMEVDVFERDLHLIKEGARAQIFLDSYREIAMPGHVRQIEPTADRQKATVLVKVAFDKLDDHVLPELGGRVVFLREGTESVSEPLVIAPSGALVTVDGRRSVFVVEGEKVRLSAVKTGETRQNGIVIESGLVGGELVVVDVPPGLTDGTQVKRE